MLSSLGATDRHVRLVMLANGAAIGITSASAGAVLGLGGWMAIAPGLQSVVDHRIDRFDLPWWAIITALVLACVTAVAAAWWPARAMARIPVVAALSGRPPRPQPAHRFAATGGVVLGAGIVLLCFADQHRSGFVIGGAVATVVGLLLLAPLAIQAIATTAAWTPISVRLALRDLARFQARSGAALGAATLAIAIAATIAISAAASVGPSTVPNLQANQLNLYIGSGGGPGNPVPVLTASQLFAAQTGVDRLAATLKAQSVLLIDAAYNPLSAPQPAQPGPGGQSGGEMTASLARVVNHGLNSQITTVAELYVATPALLSHYGINPSSISPAADIIASGSGLAGLQVFAPNVGSGPNGPPGVGPKRTRANTSATVVHPDIQVVHQLPRDRSEPTTLLTEHGMQALGLQALPADWLLQTAQPLTKAQIDTARITAASLGLAAETMSAQQSNAALRNWSTAAGILVALGVLSMTVGLIRSETANDLRTLTATGASSISRRVITGATAGTLALLGALLGTAGAYAALLAWHRSNLDPLTNIPLLDLVILLAGLPLIATAGGWLLAGREPRTIAHQPLE
jgi:putative ABC transport system permease protein